LSDRPELRARAFPPAAAWWTDASGAIVAFSPRWEAWTGRELSKELGTGWLDAVHPDDVALWNRTLRAAVDAASEFRCDLRLRTGAHWTWVRMHGLPQPDAEGRLAGFAGSATDVSDLKRAADDLGELLQAAVHDLRAPVRNLQHTLEQLAPAGELLERAQALAGSLEELLRELLEYTATGQHAPRAQPVDPGEALAWARANLRPLIERLQARIEVDPLPRVQADPIHLGRVFQNLLSNALLHAGSAAPHVRVAAAREAGWVRFAVSDDGVGIPPSAHDAIFRAFARLSPAEVPGSGLGLAICRKLIELHGGRIWVDSAPGAGATFYFTLAAEG
jgi:PAS domain S-box-containing protein